ncbi:MAG TPA: MauE/DoxX family redox-associated membrane protein [Bacteroidota bacterium]|nr:MauE/DoxX family redox-associated membrane protein [Bacteroidota bacterium]
MKQILANDYFALTARIFLGFLFLVASIDKIVDPQAFAVSIGNYKAVPDSLLLTLATILPWVELLCSLCLLSGLFLRGSSFLLSALLVIFTLAIISALLRGLDITCGCFTQDPAAGTIGWRKVLENIGLIFLSVFMVFSTSVKFSLQHYLQQTKLS